jgi:hypothetical protein
MKQAWKEISLSWANLNNADLRAKTITLAEEDRRKVRRGWKGEGTEWEPEDFHAAAAAMRNRLISSIGKEAFHEIPEVIAAAIMQISRWFPERALQADDWMDVAVDALVASHDAEGELKEMLRTHNDSSEY